MTLLPAESSKLLSSSGVHLPALEIVDVIPSLPLPCPLPRPLPRPLPLPLCNTLELSYGNIICLIRLMLKFYS